MKFADDQQNINKSGLVISGQAGIHPQLEKHLRRHLQTRWSQPHHYPTTKVYRRLQEQGAFSAGRMIILDSGCGTGESTRRLAGLYPGHLVIGADRSRVRLARAGVVSNMFQSGNCILVRAELETFWRLLAADGLSVERHYLFYPNPWPKPGHLQRRWHGHPVFPHLLMLGGEIELRCNWDIYALEFARAVRLATGQAVDVQTVQESSGVSPFEIKYLRRGQSLYRVTVPAQITAGFRSAWSEKLRMN